MRLNVKLTDSSDVSPVLAVLAFKKLELARLERLWQHPSGYQSLELRAARLSYDVAVNRAILATYGITDEFDIVAEILDPREIGRLIWEASKARKPDYVHDQAS